MAARAGAQPRPHAAGAPIELTSRNFTEYLFRLRSDAIPVSYVIREKLTLTGTVEQWKVNNLIFEGNGALFIGSTNLTIFIKGEIRSQSKDAAVFVSFTEAGSCYQPRCLLLMPKEGMSYYPLDSADVSHAAPPRP
jgi:hypothetical protein